MIKNIMNTLTLVTMVANSTLVFAAGAGNEPYPKSRCDKKLVREIYNEDITELKDAHRKFFVEKESNGMTDEQFCAWLRRRKLGIAGLEGGTEARFEECATGCGKPEPQNVEVERSVPADVRERFREVARRPRVRETVVETREEVSGGGGGGGLMSSPFMGGLLGGALGGFLGVMLASRMNQNQQPQQMFPQPFGQYGPRPPSMMPFPNQPGMMPFPNQFAGGGAGVQPWAAPYLGGAQQFGGIGQGAGAYGAYNQFPAQYGGGYAGAMPPGVLPLAPQNYGVGGYTPQQGHYNLINVGR